MIIKLTAGKKDMGIQGLLPALAKIQRKVHIKDYAHKKAGVDALCWMHQGANSILAGRAPNRTQSILHPASFLKKHVGTMVDYCISKVRLLQSHGITPFLVFDGAKLSMKSRVEDERR